MTTTALVIGVLLLTVIITLVILIVKSDDMKTSMLLRFGIIISIMVAIAALVVAQVINIQYFEYDKLVALQNVGLTSTPDTIKARRGNILADDGSLMASSMPTYYLYLDMRVESFRVKNKKTGKTFFEENVDSLAMALSAKLKDRTAAEYSRDLKRAYKQKLSEYRIYPKAVNYTDYKEISRFPILRRGAIQGGFTTKTRVVRANAFGILAKRTIGDIYGIEEKGGKNGLEMYYDKDLRGTDGLKRTSKMAGTRTNIILQPAQDGKNIVSTINIKLQETTERELMTELKRDGAEYGCAVLMEVATGQIKAMANLTRNSKGEYVEATNIAVKNELDPGSTFKTVSFLVAIDDGVIDSTTLVDTGNGIHEFYGRQMKDWTVGHRPGFGVINVPMVMYQSSNVGVSLLIDKYYKDNPQRFIDLIHNTKLDAPLELEIPGHAKVRIKDYRSKYWWKTSLPWMSIGYEVIVPPIYTLMFYNAIANGGRMMKPMFVTEIRGPLDSVRKIEPTVVNEHICGDKALGQMQKILEGVVSKGTAKAVQSKLFKIAGKTGTSQVFEHGKNKNSEGKTRHQITFCGYFPADNPMYSCIVYIREPHGAASAGGMCGKVFKNIAERAYILNGGEVPSWAKDSVENIISTEQALEQERMIHNIDDNVIPDLTELTAGEALYLLENMGIAVELRGVGRVASQSVEPGTDSNNVKRITLTLE
ncbi:MAG: PASTA domain-containing protein [Paludibacteraceae bacterium]|nr:PASTA domain-containing protein [Paludibacteraceae bacterium]